MPRRSQVTHRDATYLRYAGCYNWILRATVTDTRGSVKFSVFNLRTGISDLVDPRETRPSIAYYAFRIRERVQLVLTGEWVTIVNRSSHSDLPTAYPIESQAAYERDVLRSIALCSGFDHMEAVDIKPRAKFPVYTVEVGDHVSRRELLVSELSLRANPSQNYVPEISEPDVQDTYRFQIGDRVISRRDTGIYRIVERYHANSAEAFNARGIMTEYIFRSTNARPVYGISVIDESSGNIAEEAYICCEEQLELQYVVGDVVRIPIIQQHAVLWRILAVHLDATYAVSSLGNDSVLPGTFTFNVRHRDIEPINENFPLGTTRSVSHSTTASYRAGDVVRCLRTPQELRREWRIFSAEPEGYRLMDNTQFEPTAMDMASAPTLQAHELELVRHVVPPPIEATPQLTAACAALDVIASSFTVHGEEVRQVAYKALAFISNSVLTLNRDVSVDALDEHIRRSLALAERIQGSSGTTVPDDEEI